MGQNGNGLKTDKNGNRTEIKQEWNGITRPVVRTGDGNFFLTPTVPLDFEGLVGLLGRLIIDRTASLASLIDAGLTDSERGRLGSGRE